MAAQPARRIEEIGDEDLLDADTSAAILRWMETAVAPQGIPAEEWERWIDAGCRGTLRAHGLLVTPGMLGHWARTGTLR